jgi:hypothetical protein
MAYNYSSGIVNGRIKTVSVTIDKKTNQIHIVCHEKNMTDRRDNDSNYFDFDNIRDPVVAFDAFRCIENIIKNYL